MTRNTASALRDHVADGLWSDQGTDLYLTTAASDRDHAAEARAAAAQRHADTVALARADADALAVALAWERLTDADRAAACADAGVPVGSDLATVRAAMLAPSDRPALPEWGEGRPTTMPAATRAERIAALCARSARRRWAISFRTVRPVAPAAPRERHIGTAAVPADARVFGPFPRETMLAGSAVPAIGAAVKAERLAARRVRTCYVTQARPLPPTWSPNPGDPAGLIVRGSEVNGYKNAAARAILAAALRYADPATPRRSLVRFAEGQYEALLATRAVRTATVARQVAKAKAKRATETPEAKAERLAARRAAKTPEQRAAEAKARKEQRAAERQAKAEGVTYDQAFRRRISEHGTPQQ